MRSVPLSSLFIRRPWSETLYRMTFHVNRPSFVVFRPFGLWSSPPRLTASDDISPLVIWATVEGSVMLIAACVPTLQPLYDRFIGTSKTDSRDPPRAHHRTNTSCYSKKRSFWSAMKPPFKAASTGSWARRANGRRTVSRTCETAAIASPRTLEDAANLAYPPAAIWKQTVRVGRHSRIRSQDHTSF